MTDTPRHSLAVDPIPATGRPATASDPDVSRYRPWATARRQFGRRGRQLCGIFAREGLWGLSQRARHALANWVAPQASLPVRAADIIAADLRRPQPTPSRPMPSTGRPIRVNWVTTPPCAGAGGHSTLYRIVNHLQANGYDNHIYFYDVHLADHLYYKTIVREAYGFTGAVEDLERTELGDADALVATSWPTAYPVYNARCAGKRFYFIQDVESDFHPVGTCRVLAENTYRMGLHGITAGRWLSQAMQARGMIAEPFEFGCDTSRYRNRAVPSRAGIAYYARPSVARRAFELGALALQVLAQRRPDLPIHLYGDRVGRLPFPFIDHGRVTPEGLDDIYNQCVVGLSLSLTNVSLVPHEMLAAGCIPVVNDATHNRIVLDNPFVHYTAPEPRALAAALESVADAPDRSRRSQEAAESVRSVSWEDAGAQVDEIFRRALAG